jgi:hypothetical protein
MVPFVKYRVADATESRGRREHDMLKVMVRVVVKPESDEEGKETRAPEVIFDESRDVRVVPTREEILEEQMGLLASKELKFKDVEVETYTVPFERAR